MCMFLLRRLSFTSRRFFSLSLISHCIILRFDIINISDTSLIIIVIIATWIRHIWLFRIQHSTEKEKEKPNEIREEKERKMKKKKQHTIETEKARNQFGYNNIFQFNGTVREIKAAVTCYYYLNQRMPSMVYKYGINYIVIIYKNLDQEFNSIHF